MSLLFGRGLVGTHVCHIRLSTFLTPAARICSDEWLKMDRYMGARRAVKTRFSDHSETFSTRMRKYADPNEPSMIFSDDIKNYLHLIENKPEDLDVFKSMLVKYAGQNSLRFQTFSLGPVIMRLMLFVDNAELALDIIKDEKLTHMFNEATSYAILMSLHYRQQKYDKVIQVYDLFMQQQIEGQRWPSNILMPLAAACYKLNTPESYKKISEVYADLLKAGHKPMDRLMQLVAGLAIKQGEPMDALELISSTGKPVNFFALVNLKTLALCDAGRVKEAMVMLSDKFNNPTRQPPSIFTETLDKIKSALEKSGDSMLKEVFSKLEPQLNSKLMAEETLDDVVCKEMTVRIRPREDRREGGDDRRSGDDRRFTDDRRSDRFDRRQQYSDDAEPRYNRRQAYGSVEQSVRDNYHKQNDGFRENTRKLPSDVY